MNWSDRPPVVKGSFIDRYLTFMEGQETAFVYDLTCALYCLGVACGRGVRVNRPRAPAYLNIFAILAAESGVTRKSTAVRIARDVITRFVNEVETQYRVYESKTTPESLEYTLQQASLSYGYANGAVIVSELVTFLGREKYTMAMPGLLTDLFDSPTQRTGSGTLARGPTLLRNIYLSFLSASTPSWLIRAINPDVIEGGFTSRCLFIVDEVPKKMIAWPDHQDVESELTALSDMLVQKHKQLYGHNVMEQYNVTLSVQAKDAFTQWYETRERSRDPFRASFESREDGHILKIAALLSINNGRLEATKEEIEYAIALITWAKVQGSLIFAYSTDDKLVMGIDRLRTTLIGAGMDGIIQSEIYKKVSRYIDGAQMQYALEILHELGMVQQFEETNLASGRGRKRTRWRATELITSPGTVTAILDQWERLK